MAEHQARVLSLVAIPLKFRPVSKNGKVYKNVVESEEGYVILQCLENDKPTGRIVAFHRIPGYTSQVIGGYDSSAEAKAACEAHVGNCTCLSYLIPLEEMLERFSKVK